MYKRAAQSSIVSGSPLLLLGYSIQVMHRFRLTKTLPVLLPSYSIACLQLAGITSGLLLISIYSEHTGKLVFTTCSLRTAKHSRSSYFSQVSLLTAFARTARAGKLSAEQKCYLFSARGVQLKSKQTYGIRTTDI